jgi:glutathionylspermidine synthase
MSTITNKFEFSQALETYGAHDVEMIIYKNQLFLFISEDRNEKSSMISSSLYIYDRNQFQLKQVISTDGAHASEYFINIDNDLYLAIANFGDRLNNRYDSLSKIYKWNNLLNEMIMVAQIQTQGATDFEHFSINNIDYIIVSNEGDISNRLHQKSSLYQLKTT